LLINSVRRINIIGISQDSNKDKNLLLNRTSKVHDFDNQKGIIELIGYFFRGYDICLGIKAVYPQTRTASLSTTRMMKTIRSYQIKKNLQLM